MSEELLLMGEERMIINSKIKEYFDECKEEIIKKRRFSWICPNV
jgi:hypothetical protein